MTFGSNVVRGIWLLARGRAAGVAEFGDTVDAFLASLAPLIAFPLVATVLLAVDGQPEAAIVSFLSRLCVVLVVAVITQAFAKLTGHEAHWLRTATALNWSFWLIVPLLLVAGLVGAIMVSAGVAETLAENILIGIMAAYLLWYNLFTVRTGLQLKILPALALVVVSNLVVGVLTIGPDLLDKLFVRP